MKSVYTYTEIRINNLLMKKKLEGKNPLIISKCTSRIVSKQIQKKQGVRSWTEFN